MKGIKGFSTYTDVKRLYPLTFGKKKYSVPPRGSTIRKNAYQKFSSQRQRLETVVSLLIRHTCRSVCTSLPKFEIKLQRTPHSILV